MHLQDKVALVTGAGHRLGKAIAVGLAAGGCDVVVHYGSSSREAQATAEEIEQLGRRAWTLQADLRRGTAIDSLFESVRSACGRLDLLVNSAASFRRQPFDEINAEDWDAVHALNLRAPFLCSQRAARLMGQVSREPGESAAIINMVDLSGHATWRDFTHHGVSKAGLIHLTKQCARELAPHVRVNAVMPGAILPPPGEALESDAWKSRGERLPLAKVGEPAQVVKSILYLAENEFVTGIILPVDGGEHLIGGSRVH